MTAIARAPTAGSLNFVLLLTSNAILGTALPMMIVLGGLAGLILAPSPGLATLPASISTLAGLVAAAPFSLFMGRYGRQAGFLLGALFHGVGGAAAVLGLMQGSFLIFLIGHALLGAALACFLFFRFAAAEVVAERWKSVAISLMLTSGLIAALIGPEVFERTKDTLLPVPFAGAYAAIAVLAGLGAVPLLFLRGLGAASVSQPGTAPKVDTRAVLRRPAVAGAIVAAALAQGVMALLMVPTPIVMVACGFDAATGASVVGLHVVAMFAPSFFTGFLIQRLGARRIVYGGLSLLAVSGGIAASGITLGHFYAALILLGVGWNFAFIGATSLLTDALAPQERAVIQGINDTAIALASALAAFASGALFVGVGWSVLALLAIPVVTGAALMLFWTGRAAPAQA
ncbi:MAG: MFS transporter [Pseudomonadota bacterium]